MKDGAIGTLLIVSHVVHYRYRDQWFAYGAYAREIDVWADLFPRVIIAAPCDTHLPEDDCLPLTRSNIELSPLPRTNGKNKREKMAQLFLVMPRLAWRLARTMRRADAIQARCPAHAGLLAVLMGPVFSRFLVARYTGAWSGYSGEPWIWRLQRWILQSGWWRGPVLVYGSWPNQPSHIVPIFTSVLRTQEIQRASGAARRKKPGPLLTVLFVGRLSASKNVDVLLAAVADLVGTGVRLQCYVVGDGPERPALEQEAVRLRLDNWIQFTGGMALERVLDYYERSDVLVLVSDTEGWPKVIVEAMAFGLICIGSDQGLVPTILGEGRGLVVPCRDHVSLGAALRRIAESPESYESMRLRASSWAQQYSLDGLREVFRSLLAAHWRKSIRGATGTADAPPDSSGA